MANCPKCSMSLPPDARSCPRCGTSVSGAGARGGLVVLASIVALAAAGGAAFAMFAAKAPSRVAEQVAPTPLPKTPAAQAEPTAPTETDPLDTALARVSRSLEEAKRSAGTEEEREQLQNALVQAQRQLADAKQRLQEAKAHTPPAAEQPAERAGECDSAKISAVIRREMRKVQVCYTRELRTDPNATGKLTVRITIAASGTVQSARTTEDSLRSEPVRQCVESAVQRWVFPAAGRQCEVSFPCSFVAAK